MFSTRGIVLQALTTIILGVLVFGDMGARLRRDVAELHGKKLKYLVEIVHDRTFTKNGKLRSTGTIIGDRHVLTIADCSQHLSHEKLFVVAGVPDIKDRNGVVYPVKKLIPFSHPDDGNSQFLESNCIVLIVLQHSMMGGFRRRILQQLYVPYSQTEIGENYIIGSIRGNGLLPPSKIFHEIIASSVDQENCTKVYSSLARESEGLKSRFFCAQLNETHNCQENFGSPLVRDGYIFGVMTNQECGTNKIALFANVLSYRHWIIKSISDTYKEDNLTMAGGAK